MNTAFLILLAILGGLAVTLQGQFMGSMTQFLGTTTSMFITYAGGGAVIALFTLATHAHRFQAWRSVPWYAFTAGLLGLAIVGTIGYVVPRLGLATGFTLIVAGQFVMAALIDQFGWFGAAVRPLDLQRLAGLGLLLIAVWLINKR